MFEPASAASPSSDPTDLTDVAYVAEVVDLTDETSEDADPEILPFYGPSLPPQGDGDAAGGPPPRSEPDADADSSFEYLTSDSQGAPSLPSPPHARRV